jgi:hypothetical protein
MRMRYSQRTLRLNVEFEAAGGIAMLDEFLGDRLDVLNAAPRSQTTTSNDGDLSLPVPMID